MRKLWSGMVLLGLWSSPVVAQDTRPGVAVLPLGPDGAPMFVQATNPVGSLDGLYFDQDRAAPVQGRRADP